MCTKLARAFLHGAKHREEPFPPRWGAAGKELWPWKEDEEAPELFSETLLCFSLAFVSQIRPVIYCPPCFSSPLPASDFWPVLPREGALGRQRGSGHANEHPSGNLPASRCIQPKLDPSRAPQTPAACALTWDEPLNRSQPRSFLRLWQGTETSWFLSRFQTAPLALCGERLDEVQLVPRS